MIERSVEKAVHYIEGLNFTEAKFVLVVMVVAATRPVVALAEGILNSLAGVIADAKRLGILSDGIGRSALYWDPSLLNRRP